MKDKKTTENAGWLRKAVILAGILLEITGVILIVTSLQSQSSLGQKVGGALIGFFDLAIGLAIHLKLYLKSHHAVKRHDDLHDTPLSTSVAERQIEKAAARRDRTKPKSYRIRREEKRVKSEKRVLFNWKIVAASLVAVSTSILLLYAQIWYGNGPSPEPTPPKKEIISTDQEIKQTAEDIRSRLSYITLEEGGVTLHAPSETGPVSNKIEVEKTRENISQSSQYAKIVFSQNSLAEIAATDAPDSNDNPRAKYTITINDKYDAEYFFKVREYTIETGGDINQIPTANLCQVVDNLFDSKGKILESLHELKLKGKLSVGVGPIGVEVELENIQVAILELLYTLKKFYVLKTRKIEILIKGYADAQETKWREPLTPGYEFNLIKVYPAVNPVSLNPFDYYRKEATREIPQEYENKHLPNLRASFVAQDFIKPFVKSCGNAKNSEIHILDGYEYKNAVRDKTKRKVQIFINIY